MIKRFLSFVEIKTKITSSFAFFLTIAFLLTKNRQINWVHTSIFFISMFLFDLTTTAINNYIDTETNGRELQFAKNKALVIIFILLGISTISGLYLAYLTDHVVFLAGGLCFLCGIFYTYGPLPLSRQPLGEIFSGIFYGFFIPFLLMYINMPKGTFLVMDVARDVIKFEFSVRPGLELLLLSVIPVFTTANIMLANNICDLDRDVAVKRHTLPYYLGERSLKLFALLYYIIYADIAVMVSLRILPPLSLISLFTLPFVQKNISSFAAHQDKSSTFILSVKNYIVIVGSLTILLFTSAFLQ